MSETLGLAGVLPSQRERGIPVAEIFGPTIQGEGPLAGVATSFVRFGGCDYLCSWCDSLHAVLPQHVRELARMTPKQIDDALVALHAATPWVTLSGGNPAMHKTVGDLVDLIHRRDGYVAVETQGSRWHDWLTMVDQLVVSPKPPSSGMASDAHDIETEAFMRKAESCDSVAVKIVVFDQADYDWAMSFIEAYPDREAFLSCGTDAQGEEEIPALLARFQWLAELLANDDRRDMHERVRVLPQLHVLAWGHRLGV